MDKTLMYELNLTFKEKCVQAFLDAALINYFCLMMSIFMLSSITNVYVIVGFGVVFTAAIIWYYVKNARLKSKIIFYESDLLVAGRTIAYSDIKRFQFIKMHDDRYQFEFRVDKQYYCFTMSEIGRDIIKGLLNKD